MQEHLKLKVSLAAIGALSVVLILVIVTTHFENIRSKTQVQRIGRAYQIDSFGLWRYGVIESTNKKDSSLTIAIATNFGNGRLTRKFKVTVTTDTKLYQQSLTSEGEVYTGRSELTPVTFETLQPGMYAGITIDNGPDASSLVARTIIVGNPL